MLAKYCQDDKIKNVEIGGICRTYEQINVYNIWVWKTNRNILFSEEGIQKITLKWIFREMGCDNIN